MHFMCQTILSSCVICKNSFLFLSFVHYCSEIHFDKNSLNRSMYFHLILIITYIQYLCRSVSIYLFYYVNEYKD